MIAFKTEEALGISSCNGYKTVNKHRNHVSSIYSIQLTVFCCCTTANCLEFTIANKAATPTVSETVGRDTVYSNNDQLLYYSFNNSSRAPSCGKQ